MQSIEHQFSDLLRRPKEVAADVDKADVVLHRREQPDLRLTRADRESEKQQTLVALGRAFRSIADRHPAALEEGLYDALPWIKFLPEDDRKEFMKEVSGFFAAAADLNSYGELALLLREWRATAEIHSDPKLAFRLKSPATATGVAVSKPRR